MAAGDLHHIKNQHVNITPGLVQQVPIPQPLLEERLHIPSTICTEDLAQRSKHHPRQHRTPCQPMPAAIHHLRHHFIWHGHHHPVVAEHAKHHQQPRDSSHRPTYTNCQLWSRDRFGWVRSALDGKGQSHKLPNYIPGALYHNSLHYTKPYFVSHLLKSTPASQHNSRSEALTETFGEVEREDDKWSHQVQLHVSPQTLFPIINQTSASPTTTTTTTTTTTITSHPTTHDSTIEVEVVQEEHVPPPVLLTCRVEEGAPYRLNGSSHHEPHHSGIQTHRQANGGHQPVGRSWRKWYDLSRLLRIFAPHHLPRKVIRILPQPTRLYLDASLLLPKTPDNDTAFFSPPDHGTRPYSYFYATLLSESFMGFMDPGEERTHAIIIHGVSTHINVNFIEVPGSVHGLKRRMVDQKLRSQLLGVTNKVAREAHLLGLGRRRMKRYMPVRDLRRHCSRWGHKEWRCQSSLI
ncbi:hypothetical protein E2C01_012889 [Portunus trituberculatus]|uniref:Uncharacterized protein n=1 Tax=Portunus trituberculatus TaxID=210409 RepID=A0A5B7DF21_PORTR|nr:hypothetical protein [Portunus trituberculatus]